MWEAMACGKCIVTTETEAIKEVLTPDAAVLVPNESVEKDLPGILEGLLSDGRKRDEYGRNARRRATEVLEPWAKRAEREVRLLEELVGRR
jgi:glycosyltransferase involved in cell wall biosynthesis